jgi:crossover junction endodeoxyribonuclease RusA
MAINLELHWPPSVNKYWKPRTIRGRTYVYLTNEAKQWRTDALWMIRQQLGQYKPLLGRLKVTVNLTPPRNIGDIDNYHKPLFDGLEHAQVFVNDRQIKELHTYFLPAVAPGFVRLAIEELATDRYPKKTTETKA